MYLAEVWILILFINKVIYKRKTTKIYGNICMEMFKLSNRIDFIISLLITISD